LSHYS